MNLYLISQTQNENYDSYDAAVVVAPSEDHARNMIPGGATWEEIAQATLPPWCSSPDQVTVEYLGVAAPHMTAPHFICCSFNAG